MKFLTTVQNIWIDLVPHEKLMTWTQLARGEFSCLGLVEDLSTGPCITDVFLLKQTCSAASTDLDQQEIAKLMFDLAAAGLEGQLRAWVHSHAAMDCFWSRTDDDCIEGLGGDNYIVSLVVNKKGDQRARVDVFSPVRFVIDDVPVKLRTPDLGLLEQCRAEFQAKVNEAPVFPAFSRTILGKDVGALPVNQDSDLFQTEQHGRPFAQLELEDLESAVQRGELTMREYFEAVDGYMEPWADEVADGRRA